jgi:hypothetical protein
MFGYFIYEKRSESPKGRAARGYFDLFHNNLGWPFCANLLLPNEAYNVYYRFTESTHSTAGGGSMTPNRTDERPTEERRKEIFLALVEAQDQAMDVAQSRKLVSERFGIIESQVQQIEREGLDHNWPPL